ncbi:MAG: toll/interleukin-1 receptor domain-containing protein [Planctomycetes bacterium]|nr:toll/interleukin-1 receptor domain-containing protein [Planctomycetota bacterium]
MSYRRADTKAIAYRIHDSLCKEFGKASGFIDGDIKPGDDFPRILAEEIQKCDVVLLIVGKNWEPSAYVGYEMETARVEGKRLIPVLIDDATVPDVLPPPFHKLSKVHAVKIDTGSHYEEDLKRLVHSLGSVGARIAVGMHDRCKEHQQYQDLLPKALKTEMTRDESDMYLLLLNAVEPNQCKELRKYFVGGYFPGSDRIDIEGIYDLFGRFEFLVKLRVPGDDPSLVEKILVDLRKDKLISPPKTSDAILPRVLNVTHEYYPKPHIWVPLDETQRALKAFLHVYPWRADMRRQFLDNCHRAADHHISTVGVFIASKGDHSELVAEYYSGCGSYYDQVRHILDFEDGMRSATNRNALLVMKANKEKKPNLDKVNQPAEGEKKSSPPKTVRRPKK